MTQPDGLAALDAERSVLGAILLDDRHLTALLVDEHLAPEHFADTAHALIYRAAIDLQDTARPIDHLTVTSRLQEHGQLEQAGGKDAVEELTAWVPATGHAREYGRLIRERFQARQLLAAARQIQSDVLARSQPITDVVEHAAQLVADVAGNDRHGTAQHTWTPEQLRDWFLDDLDNPGEDVWHTPFPALDELLGGGIARGEQMLIAADEGLGKSHLIDAFLERFAQTGARAHLYVNEGGKKLRLRRFITRHTGIPGRALKHRDLTADQMRRAFDAMTGLKVGITDCTGWTAPEIVRHIKRNRWDVFAVDIAHNIVKTEAGVEGWDLMAAQLRAAPVQADGAMLLAVHTRKRGTIADEPPVSDDIRDTKMFAALADSVLLLHRKRDEGALTSDGMLILAKARDGETGKLKVTFSPSRLEFMPADTAAALSWRSSPDTFIEPTSNEFEVAEGVRF